MMRGVSAMKEDVHNAIKNIDKAYSLKPFAKSFPTYWVVTPNIAISCMLMVPAPNQALHTCTGKRRATSLYGKALRKMPLL